MNIDVVFEILLHLPVRSLFRFRAVCKLWCYDIDSPHFIKLHTLLRRNNYIKDEEVYLRFISTYVDNSRNLKSISINLLGNGKKLLMSHKFPVYDLILSWAVKGLVCLSSPLGKSQVAICNPFLGQFKILPLPPYTSAQSSYHLDRVGLGFDEYYKVVHLRQCNSQRCLLARLYSERTNSWSNLDIDQDLVIQSPIKSWCKNGSFVHWEGRRGIYYKKIIVSFDMKNEEFRTTSISSLMGDEVFYYSSGFRVLAKSDFSFVILVFDRQRLKVYESSGEGSELVWNNVSNVELKPFWRRKILESDDIPIWRNDDRVVVRGSKYREVILYDYHARKLIRRFNIHTSSSSTSPDDIIEYEGSLISP
ncbi:hypothetical protein SASPL_156941 [Salvia splendens]|uniref:F-box domain-containing protein n=1 Tax=Salvia splendens TaxID=180675 RepID=A0A8X8VVT1_SALSN|nr:F-box/kelch-repeat protein At3g06240-like [Salvia splendens]KAG6383310.1 hypothetical protein SASPL_156941 [Salvia splendens]